MIAPLLIQDHSRRSNVTCTHFVCASYFLKVFHAHIHFIESAQRERVGSPCSKVKIYTCITCVCLIVPFCNDQHFVGYLISSAYIHYPLSLFMRVNENRNNTGLIVICFLQNLIQLNLCKTAAKIDKTNILMTNGSLMKVESTAECSPWNILHYFLPVLSDNWS